ncbi:MAG TPA: hypothetical protein DCS97_00395 [Planctomycetes bacterium]|nr:hypothetical protein [Planctomycetota bacterium]
MELELLNQSLGVEVGVGINHAHSLYNSWGLSATAAYVAVRLRIMRAFAGSGMGVSPMRKVHRHDVRATEGSLCGPMALR